MTFELALLALEAGAEEHLLVAVVADGDHVEGLGEPMRDVVRHACAHRGRAWRARHAAAHHRLTHKRRCNANASGRHVGDVIS